jgi:hypothetical protein
MDGGNRCSRRGRLQYRLTLCAQSRWRLLLRRRIRSDFERWKLGSVFQLLGRNTRSRYVLWMPDTHRYIYRSIGKLDCGPPSLRASYLGTTDQDHVGPQGQLTPDGVPDWHIQLQGLRPTPVQVQITSTAGGVWQTPYNGANWVISVQSGASGSGDLFFEPWSSPGFRVKV